MTNTGAIQKRSKSGRGAIAPGYGAEGGPTRVAFLVRVSSDEQDDRGTIENQKQYLERNMRPTSSRTHLDPWSSSAHMRIQVSAAQFGWKIDRRVAAWLTIVQRDGLT
jgi:hypothetical protein